MHSVWIFNIVFAVANLIVDRQLELDPGKESTGIFADQFHGRTNNKDQSNSSGQHREPRVVASLPEAPITIGFIYNIPVSIFFPFIRRRLVDLGREDSVFEPNGRLRKRRKNQKKKTTSPMQTTEKHDKANKGNKKKRRKKKKKTKVPVASGSSLNKTEAFGTDIQAAPLVSVPADESENKPVDDSIDLITTQQSILGSHDDQTDGSRSFPSGRDFQQGDPWWWIPTFEAQRQWNMDLIDMYFSYLEVEEDACRLQFICQLASHPERYYPLSDIFLRHLRPSEEQEDHAGHVFDGERFYKFFQAAKIGFNNIAYSDDANECDMADEEGYSCASTNSAVDDVIDMGKLWISQQLAQMVNVEFSVYE